MLLETPPAKHSQTVECWLPLRPPQNAQLHRFDLCISCQLDIANLVQPFKLCAAADAQFPVIIKRLESVMKQLPDDRLNPASVPTPHRCCAVQ